MPGTLRLVCAAALAAAAAALFLFVRAHDYSLYDDAFIYLRYVKNVRAGCGLRFNCSEPPVEGFSGPLYLGLLVLGSRVTTKLVTLTQVLGVAGMAGALACAILGAAARGQGDARSDVPRRAVAAAAVAALLALDPYVLLNAVIGLESPLAALAVTALAVLAARSGPRAQRLTVALAFVVVLLRPEGLVFVALLPILPWARRPRVLAACALGVAAIVAVRWAIFADVAPNTYWAKSGGTARHFALGARYVADALVDFPAIALAPLALAVRGDGPRAPAAYVLASSGAWLALLVSAGGDTFEYSRLVFPLVPALTMLGVRSALALAARFGRAGLLAPAALSLALAARAAFAHALAPMHGFDNVTLWTAVGKHLKARYPGKVIATVPVGAIAYFSELEVIDLVGLGSRPIAKAGRTVPPEMLTKKWIGHERHDLEYVLARAPDLVVTTKVRATPWATLDEASAGFYADWLILRAAKAGAPYRVLDLALAPDVHVLALARTP